MWFFIKKVIVVLSLLALIYLNINKEEIIIPNDSIRFRIIANSNNIEDQLTKQRIKEDIIKQILPEIVKNPDIDTSIKTNIPAIKKILNTYKVPYDISYGDNYFPGKTYKGINYPAGYYNSLVITLGQGLGENFWCVMYPPLCLIEDNKTDNIEYKSYIKEVLSKYE